MDVIEDDITFLNSQGLMDYSLLLCVETNWSKDELNRMAIHEAEEKARNSHK